MPPDSCRHCLTRPEPHTCMQTSACPAWPPHLSTKTDPTPAHPSFPPSLALTSPQGSGQNPNPSAQSSGPVASAPITPHLQEHLQFRTLDCSLCLYDQFPFPDSFKSASVSSRRFISGPLLQEAFVVVPRLPLPWVPITIAMSQPLHLAQGREITGLDAAELQGDGHCWAHCRAQNSH